MNYIVSNFREIWDSKAKEIFISDPCLFFNLQQSNDLKKYNKFEVAEHVIQTSEDINRANLVCDQYREKFLSILIPELNIVHNRNFNKKFWEFVLSVGMDRYISLCYEFFKHTESNYKAERHFSFIIKDKHFYYPSNFDDQRDFLQNNNLGYEQLFSIYIRTFYPLKVIEKDIYPKDSQKKKSHALKFRSIFNKINWIKISYLKLIKYVLLTISPYLKKEVLLQRVLFSDRNFIKIFIKSFGKISSDDYLVKIPISVDSKFVNAENRERLSSLIELIENPDRFEIFFFKTIKSLFPRLYLEDFHANLSKLEKWSSSYNNLKFVVSETWPSDSFDALKVAVLRNNHNIKLVYNEHNCIEHCYIGSLVHKHAKLVDYFYSLGWKDETIANLEPAGSFFNFHEKLFDFKSKKDHKVCFVGGAMLSRRPQFSTGYSFASYGALKSIEITDKFLTNLPKKIIRDIYFRAYPTQRLIGVIKYNYEKYLENKFKFKTIDYKNTDSKKVMLSSNLVIVNYISTTHLETLSMNIPTIILIDESLYSMNLQNMSFFDSFIDVGILHTSPKKAAEFLESIYDSIYDWWLDSKVQKARQEFLKVNFESSENFSNKLLSLLD